MPPHDFSRAKQTGGEGLCIWGCGTLPTQTNRDEECPKHPRSCIRPIPVSLKDTDISARIAELRKERDNMFKSPSEAYDPSED